MPRAAKQLDQYPRNPTANSGSPRYRACSHAVAAREGMIVGPQLSSAERQAKARWSLSQAYAHGTWKPDFKLLAQVGNIGEPNVRFPPFPDISLLGLLSTHSGRNGLRQLSTHFRHQR